ncbi:MAG: methyltransferase domain-containing protein, partial [Alphaproteobacteria bacterium]|nr:methyltransferase domain-containing protein [Alphaproteobacteria bacterium]
MREIDYYHPDGLSCRLYDVIHEAIAAEIRGDLDFYAGLAGTAPTRVLEFGTGTGRIACGLAERGHAVTGLDRSPAMLALALAKRAGLAIRLIQADFTRPDLDVGERFPLVLAPFYALNHLPDDDSVAAALATARRHLQPGGLFAAHTMGVSEAMKKVLIIGGGFAGCSAAHLLTLQGGWDITLIDSAPV